ACGPRLDVLRRRRLGPRASLRGHGQASLSSMAQWRGGPGVLPPGHRHGWWFMFLSGQVFAAGQQPDPRRERDGTRQLNSGWLSKDISALDGQGAGDVTVPGMDGD